MLTKKVKLDTQKRLNKIEQHFSPKKKVIHVRTLKDIFALEHFEVPDDVKIVYDEKIIRVIEDVEKRVFDKNNP